MTNIFFIFHTGNARFSLLLLHDPNTREYPLFLVSAGGLNSLRTAPTGLHLSSLGFTWFWEQAFLGWGVGCGVGGGIVSGSVWSYVY